MDGAEAKTNIRSDNIGKELAVPYSPPPNPIKPKETAPQRFNWSSLAYILLPGILLLGAYFRFTGLDWGDNTHLHPDERFLTIVAAQLQPVDSFGSYIRTSESTLNPYNMGQSFFVYGNFPMTATRYVAEWVKAACDRLANSNPNEAPRCLYNFITYDGIHLIGRFLSALVDLLSVFFTFLIGQRLYGRWVGLLAALLLAAAVMPIQQSHFFTMDNWAAALTTMTVYTAVRAAGLGDAKPDGKLIWYALFGLTFGLAVASRINMAPLALIVNVSALVWLVQRGNTWHSLRCTSAGQADVQRVILGVLIAAVISIFTFRLAMPYAFADSQIARQEILATTGKSSGNSLEVTLRAIFSFNPQWQRNMEEIQQQQSPDASFPPATQWTDRTPILFPLVNMLLYGMGLTAGIMVWIGFFWALWRIMQARPDWTAHAILVFWSGFYFLFMGTRWVKSIRYFLPIYPTLLLLAAWALLEIYRRAATKDNSQTVHWRVLAGSLILLVVVPTILWANTFVQIYQKPETRVSASAWIYENIPSGATLLYEVDDQQKELHLPLKWYDFQAGGPPLHLGFQMPEDGLVTAVRLNYMSVPPDADTGGEESFTFMAGYNPGEGSITEVSLDNTKQAVVLDLYDQFISAGNRQQVVVQMTSSGLVRADTSRLMNEEWDEIIPVSLDGRAAYSSYYTEVQNSQRPVRIPDTNEKQQQLVDWLEEADYIILSSQRAVWSMPRIPLTYPLMIAYYEALFNGELGFELVHQEQANLHIGPLYIGDTTGQISWGKPPSAGWPPPGGLAAEEAFSVYDHPPVWIFQKTDEYNRETVAQIFGSVDLAQPIFQTPGQATKTPNALFLSDEALAEQRANGTYRELFRVDGILNQNPWLAAIIWWLAVVLLGWLAFPLTAVILRGLPSRGYIFSRVFAILLVSWLGWLAASFKLMPNSAGTLLLAVLLVGCISLLVFWRRRREITYFVRENSRFILMAELLAAAFYILFIGIRLGNPDLWGGETPMALTYLMAVLKSTSFPPYDPWFAGGYINYYYYGFVFVGVLAKLLGIMPTIAYNLMLPMLFSFTGMGAFSIAYDLVEHQETEGRRPDLSKDSGNRIGDSLPNLSKNGVMAGLLAMLLAVILGNLAQFGDLRTRTIGLPLMLLALAWAVSLSLLPTTQALLVDRLKQANWWETGLQWLAGGVMFGVFQAANIGDSSTYLVIAALAIFFYVWQRHGRDFSLPMCGQAGLLIGALWAIAYLAFWPFSSNFGTGFSSVALRDGSNTYVSRYLIVYGLFLFFITTYLLIEFRDWTYSWTLAGMEAMESAVLPLLLALLIFVGTLFVLWQLQYWAASLILILTLTAGLLGLRHNISPSRRVVLIMIALALSLMLFVEFFIVEGAVGRMNTVFEVYIQVWLLLSVAAGVTAVWSWPIVKRKHTRRMAWSTVLVLLLIAAAFYPILAIRAKWAIRISQTAPNTLDGMAFMSYASYNDVNDSSVPLGFDHEAIQWIQREISGSPVITEGHSDNYYHPISNRIAMYTGLPNIIGGSEHQRQQRVALPGRLIDERVNDTHLLYSTNSVQETRNIIEKYDVGYIYVGQLERVLYPFEGLAKFSQMVDMGLLEEIYTNERTTIYRVITSPVDGQ